LIIMLCLIIIVLLPGEILYNTAYIKLINNNPIGALATLNTWSKFPVKTERYYNKKALINYMLYSETPKKIYLENSLTNSKRASSFDKGYGVDYELEATVYSQLGEYEKAVESLKKQIHQKKYTLINYDNLLDAYQKLYYRDVITKEKYFDNIKEVEESILGLKKLLNPKAKYMNNQPRGSLNNYELIKIAEAYISVNDMEGYSRYLELVDKKSKIYKEFIGK
jgi:tetratricopeptide (TPR) repeat protein